MSDPDTIVAFGSADFEIASVLGPKIRHALLTASSGKTFIIKEQTRGNLSSATILAAGLPLKVAHLQLIKNLVAEPRAYYCGEPVFRRLPPRQNFAIQLQGDIDILDLMIDLHNPAWGFYCQTETYQNWNWVGNYFKDMARYAFPQFASKGGKSVWKKGVISQLELESQDQ